MYLEPPAIRATLATAARLSGATGGILFDFLAPPGRWQLLIRLAIWLRARRVAKLGEPWRTPLRPEDARAWLVEAGFAHVEVLGPEVLAARYLRGVGTGCG